MAEKKVTLKVTSVTQADAKRFQKLAAMERRSLAAWAYIAMLEKADKEKGR